jgi:hypothetical protein
MIRVGAAVRLKSGEVPGYPVTTVARVDEQAGKAQIRFSRPPGVAGYSYLFWRELAEIQAPPSTVTHTTGDQGGEDDGSSTTT